MDGRADGTSMADEAFKDEAEVQSHFAAVQEVGDYDPEIVAPSTMSALPNQAIRLQMDPAATSSTGDVNGGNRPAKRLKIAV